MNPCPPAEQLEQFLDGQLDDAKRTALARHIDGCPACQALLETITGPASLAGSSIQLPRPTAAPNPESLASHASFLSQLKQKPPGQTHRSNGSPGSGHGHGAADQPNGQARKFPSVAGYEILAEIGRGGMGVVYKARHLGLGRLVALKMILAGPHAGAKDQSRFRQEAEAVARLRHPNLIQIYDIGESNGCPYLALEFVEGTSLAQILRGTPQPLMPAARLIEILAEAIHYAHQQGIIHRDLKPANVLLEGRTLGRGGDDEGISCLVPRPTAPVPNPKITDFGLAKRLDTESATLHSGEIVGTPSYMAPEQAARSGKAVGPAADVYALGAILYELLTGRPPFRGPTSFDTVLQVLHEDPVQPSYFRSDLPRDLETICLKCLAKDPERRYASAKVLAEDLARFRKGQPIKARPIGLHEHVWKWARRRPMSAAIVAMTILAAVSAYLTITWLWHDARTARDDMVIQRERAEEARRNEAEHRKRARTSLYFSRVAQSQLQWRLNDFHGAEQSLEKCLPGEGEDDERSWEWHYLQGLIHNDLLQLPHEHAGLSGGVAYNKQGNRIATVVSGQTADDNSQPAEVRIWDARTGALLETWPGPSALHRIAYHPDGTQLALATADGAVMIWDAANGKELLHRPMHQGKINAIAFSPDGTAVASAGADGSVKIWDSTAGTIHTNIAAHAEEIHAVVFHPQKAVLASSSADATVKLWDIATGKEIRTLRGHKIAVLSVAFSPDGDSLVSASGNGNLKIWDVEAGRITQSLTSDTGGILHVVFSADGRYLAKAGKDGSVRIWHLTTGVERMAFRGHANPVECVAFSPDCQRVASISPLDGLAKVWDLTRHPEYGTFARAEKDVEAMVFVEAGKRLMSVDAAGKLQVWDASTGMLLAERTFPVNPSVLSPAVPIALSADGRQLAARGDKDARTVQCWDTDTGTAVGAPRDHPFPVACIRFSSNGRYLATCACAPGGTDAPHEIKIWDNWSGHALATLAGKGRIFNAAFAADGRLLAVSGQDGRVHLWPWESAAAAVEVNAHQGDVTGLAFSANGELLSSAGLQDRRVKIWNVAALLAGDAKEIHTMAAPSLICDLAFSPDNRRLVAISRDKVRIWDVETGHEALTLRGAPQRYRDPAFNPRLAFSPDGTLLAGTNWDESISLWEAPPLSNGAQFAKFQEKRRRFADERSSFWHLQEAELCLARRNMKAARFHVALLTDDFPAGPLQIRKDRLQAALRQPSR